MADRGIGSERGGDFPRVGGVGQAHRQRNRDPAGLARQADHAVGVGAGGGNQDAAARRQEAAQCGLGDEVAAALQRQAGMLVRRAARELKDAGAQSGEKMTKVIVPGGDVLGQRLADLGTSGDGAGD